MYIASLILLLTFATSSYATGSIKIVASTPHIASIVNMIVEKDAQIEVISNSNSCPEHYQLKPSDIKKAEAADLVLYIDEKFEPFMSKVLAKFPAKNTLKASSIKGMRIKDNNMHIWLDLKNAELIMDAAYSNLIKIAPQKQKAFKANLAKGKDNLKKLAVYKKKSFGKVKHAILLSDSLKYLLEDTRVSTSEIYVYPSKVSLKTISTIMKIPKPSCILGSSSDKWVALEKKIGQKIVDLDSEKWSSNKNQFDRYIPHYRNIVNKVREQCS